MNKKNLFPIISLTAIGVAVAALLAAVNMITAPRVAEAQRQKILASLGEVMPGGDFGEEIVSEPIPEDVPETVQAIYKEKSGMGNVVILSTQGYASTISITVGIDSYGKITRAVVTSEQESHGQAGMNSYTDRFTGLDAGGAASADPYTGATVTSAAIRSAIVDAMYALGYVTDTGSGDGENALPRTDAEIKALAEELVGGAVEETILSNDAPKTLKRLYYHAESESYIAYNITSTKHVAVETESIVVINSQGYISDIDLLTWVVGHGVNPHEGYASSFIGKDKNSVVSTDLVTGATGTSDNLSIAVNAALMYVAPGNDAARIDGIVTLSVGLIAAIGYTVIYKIRRRRK